LQASDQDQHPEDTDMQKIMMAVLTAMQAERDRIQEADG